MSETEGLHLDKLREKTVECLNLCWEGQQKTPRVFFCEFKGHVNIIDISVRKSKEEYQTILFEESILFAPRLEILGEERRAFLINQIEKCEYIIARLQRFIKEDQHGAQ
jgi:hypothetical protein